MLCFLCQGSTSMHGIPLSPANPHIYSCKYDIHAIYLIKPVTIDIQYEETRYHIMASTQISSLEPTNIYCSIYLFWESVPTNTFSPPYFLSSILIEYHDDILSKSLIVDKIRPYIHATLQSLTSVAPRAVKQRVARRQKYPRFV